MMNNKDINIEIWMWTVFWILTSIMLGLAAALIYGI